MAPSASVLQIFVFKNGEFIGTDLFTQREVVVGRDAAADLMLESGTVSRSHAIFEHDGKRVFVRDAGSTNGVFVNSTKVDRGEVGRLDQVFVGEYALKVKLVAQGGAPSLETDQETRAIPEEAVAAATAAAAAAFTSPSPRLASSVGATSEPTTVGKPPAAPSNKPHVVEPEPVAAIQSERERAPERPVERAAERPVERPAERPTRAGPAHALAAKLRAVAKPKPHADMGDRAPFFDVGAGGSAHAAAAVAPKLRERPQPNPEFSRGAVLAEALPVHRPAPVISPDDDEDEDDEKPYVPTFSMLRQALDTGSDLDEPTHVEVLVTRGSSLTQAVALRRGDSYYYYTPGTQSFFRRGPRRRRLVKFKRNGECRLEFDDSARGSLQRRGERLDLESASTPGRSGWRRATLRSGESIEIEEAQRSYHIRLVQPPLLPQDKRSLKQRLHLDKLIAGSMSGSLGAHVLLLLLGFLMPARTVAPAVETESFAEVKLDKEVHLEEPPPPPPAPTPVKETPTAPTPKVSKSMEAAPNKHARAGGTAKAPPGVLGLLSKVGSSAAPGPAAALAAVSNLSAANAPAGASGFRVSGLTSNLPTSDILVGGGGGGGVVTKGGAALLRGGGGGAGQLSGKGTRQVGGLVEKMPQAMRSAGQGSLDRDAIQKVINQNVGQIQRCYERELLSNPGLSGKVEVEWTVATNGSVHSARQKFSSLESVNAVNCIIDKIRSWRFPEPKGGEVVVSYPFVFKSINF